ncbi:MAG: 2-oxo acid dehydrogenase subunit E2 [Lentimicrobium sp.]|uniref:2-oxo acid dehydrogenase subunit E2 n=1 Tax=Lentimicrobium sp. TaxID=2034841 RepID=UPI0025D5C132|nr:2-oxo acid dehydrogenase subunit E2 [Lentimicrobium sp.]MCO5255626.1 2-oxo acid dehydrogenase subunit E2 [Lentimicrobium sp.]MCO5261560.1 2-oxo acid dehydrogenase subunit E2 [Lentimicrobium sp.]
MKPSHTYHRFPLSRIATFDVMSAGKKKHHVSALLEFDVSEGRKRLREIRKAGSTVSFNAWILKSIGITLAKHGKAASFRAGRRRIISFDDINISMLVEKVIDGEKVPIPLLIQKVNGKSLAEITRDIEDAKNQQLSGNDILLHRKRSLTEGIYYRLPGFLRRLVWQTILNRPFSAFSKMGNVSVTSLGMTGKISGWFIPVSVHPVTFGIGSVIQKAVVVNNEVVIRDMLNVTVLLDHDVIDGGPMVRFINDLAKSVEQAEALRNTQTNTTSVNDLTV